MPHKIKNTKNVCTVYNTLANIICIIYFCKIKYNKKYNKK